MMVRLSGDGGNRTHERFLSTDDGARYVCEPEDVYGRGSWARHGFWVPNGALYRPRQRSKVVEVAPKIGRNDPCPCGSGRKSKKCCLAEAA